MLRVLAGWLYALGAAAAAGGAAIYAANIPDMPREDELVAFSGFLVGVALEKDFDGTDIVYLRFRDHPRVYAYLSDFPSYVEIRDRLGIYRRVDLLVEADALEGEGPPAPVWGLVEHDPGGEGTVVTYEDIYLETTQTDRSWQDVGIALAVAGLAALALGFAIRRTVPYRPREPTA